MLNIQKNIPLNNFSNFKIGGIADYFAEVFSTDELSQVLAVWKKNTESLSNSSVFVLGSGTNILFSDNGFKGLIIKNSIGGINQIEDVLEVGAGVIWADLNKYCIDNSLSGIEWSGGLPGTVGGAIRGNAGAHRGETKDNILEVESLNIDTLELKNRNKVECNFGYRNSIFKNGEGEREIIIKAKFKFNLGFKDEIQKLTQEKIDGRILRHPLEHPNIGSIFKNVPVDKFSDTQMIELSQYIKQDPFPVIPTAKLIFLAGLKGKRVGDAQLSEKHTNFIVNLGSAKSSEVKELISIIKLEIKNKFNVDLEEEVIILN